MMDKDYNQLQDEDASWSGDDTDWWKQQDDELEQQEIEDGRSG